MPKGKFKAALKEEVNIGRFPPYICYQILYNDSEERRVMPTFLKVDLHGADVPLTFTCRFNEAECECPGFYLLWVCMYVHACTIHLHVHIMYILAICFFIVLHILYNSIVSSICFLQIQPSLCSTASLILLREQLVGVMHTYIS